MTNDVYFGKFSWWYWIVAFAIVVVILLIIIIGVCMHRYCKVQRERGRQGNNNGTGGLDEPILDADDVEAFITSV